MKSPKKAKVTNAQVRPSGDGKQVQANFGFNTPIGNSQINGFASEGFKNIGLQHTYPINNFMGVTGGVNYSNFNYPDHQGSDLSGNLGMNYKRPVGKNTDIDLTASLDLNKEGLSPGFNVGLVKRFPHGGDFHVPQHILDSQASIFGNPSLIPSYTPIEPSKTHIKVITQAKFL